MNNELTALDIKKMQEELDHRKLVLMPEQIAEVQLARSHGDLSENFEYKAAKQALNRNKSRMRYLEKMIKTAKIIEDKSTADEVGLYDYIELDFGDGDTETVQVVTTVRCNPLESRISKESPLGKAILGKKAGDKVLVESDDGPNYSVTILSIKKAEDDGSAPLLSY